MLFLKKLDVANVCIIGKCNKNISYDISFHLYEKDNFLKYKAIDNTIIDNVIGSK